MLQFQVQSSWETQRDAVSLTLRMKTDRQQELFYPPIERSAFPVVLQPSVHQCSLQKPAFFFLFLAWMSLSSVGESKLLY